MKRRGRKNNFVKKYNQINRDVQHMLRSTDQNGIKTY